eukprot:GILJ01021464.1.p2 GENE.GILJ01021464.1~~GILJ01021464.1.p2  ORF type:complete len:136 (+),score=5.28 GILJ01021464.1:361-768(+)
MPPQPTSAKHVATARTCGSVTPVAFIIGDPYQRAQDAEDTQRSPKFRLFGGGAQIALTSTPRAGWPVLGAAKACPSLQQLRIAPLVAKGIPERAFHGAIPVVRLKVMLLSYGIALGALRKIIPFKLNVIRVARKG